MAKVTLSKDSLTVPTIIFNNGALSSDESGNLTWNGLLVGGSTLDASGDITFTGLDTFTQYVTFNGGMISNGDIILNGSKLLLANGASVELYQGTDIPLPEGGSDQISPGTGNSGVSIDTSNFFKLDTNNTIKGYINLDKSSLNTFSIGYPYSNKTGALLSLRSIDYPELPGSFLLIAQDATNTTSLTGRPGGYLTWAGKNVVTEDFLDDINWGSDITKDPYIGINNSKMAGPFIYFRRGNSDRNPGALELASRGSDNVPKTLILKPDGTITWDGKNVLTEGSVKSSVTEALKNGTSWYIKYSNGLILQGGTLTITANLTTVTFPTPFSSIPSVYLSRSTTRGQCSWDNELYPQSISNSNFSYKMNTTEVSNATWFAIGC